MVDTRGGGDDDGGEGQRPSDTHPHCQCKYRPVLHNHSPMNTKCRALDLTSLVRSLYALAAVVVNPLSSTIAPPCKYTIESDVPTAAPIRKAGALA